MVLVSTNGGVSIHFPNETLLKRVRMNRRMNSQRLQGKKKEREKEEGEGYCKKEKCEGHREKKCKEQVSAEINDFNRNSRSC